MIELTVYVTVASKYIRIRQSWIMEKLNKRQCDLQTQLHKMSKRKGSKKFPNKRPIRSNIAWTINWGQHRRINAKVATLCSHIASHAAYWSPCLTLLFLFYIYFLCIVLYITLFVDALVLSMRILLVAYLINLQFLLYLMIHQCACVVRNNQRIVRFNGQIYLSYARIWQKCSNHGGLVPRHLLKVGICSCFYT